LNWFSKHIWDTTESLTFPSELQQQFLRNFRSGAVQGAYAGKQLSNSVHPSNILNARGLLETMLLSVRAAEAPFLVRGVYPDGPLASSLYGA